MKNIKDSKIFKVPKRNSKPQKGCHLEKNSKFKRDIQKKKRKKKSRERLTPKKKVKNFKNLRIISEERFQVSKIQERFQKWKFSKMNEFE